MKKLTQHSLRKLYKLLTNQQPQVARAMTGDKETAPRKVVTRGPGRRSGSVSSRQAVLDAARARFANDGFTATTMRRVAADAGVDVSMVMQFFRSKDGLFAAVMNIPQSALEKLGEVFEGADEQLGERVVRAFFKAWEGEPEESEPLTAMLRNAMVNVQARDHLRDYIESRLATGGTETLGPNARLRAGLALSMLVGVLTGRQIIGVPVLAEAQRETLVTTLAPAIQQTLLPTG
ncbi:MULTISPECIES: TetR family transcriptional regulator [unclassified Pseudomonas]|uniref:TetR/AcrR family transcriptional regulator n=1 Tax=unclassified Pseudomonas TaxID=196821 RepID=UPI0021C6868F|nr:MULTISPECIES: TetR family transcriptional regulator [unclassified Pseudomonas]MCU1734256.1 TetR family transcriptional regulator [Pseudomonas sp. 20P_3.2_Bac4]MCU1743097.1 TetR family transcriptional regulator [Pseudomonas sp. 20P_3.2_Bac5]